MNNLDKVFKVYMMLGNMRRRYHVKDVKKNVSQTLNTMQKKSVIEYYKPYAKVKTVFHAFYTEKTGEFHPEYIPDDLYYTKIDPYFNDWHSAMIVDNKCTYEQLFSRGAVKLPHTVLYRINHFWFNDCMEMQTKDSVDAIIINQKMGVFVKQAVDSAGGHGVKYLECSANSDNSQFWKTVNDIDVDVIVQEPLEQCEELNRVNASSVNTIRILSLLSSTGVKIYSTVLRMGVKGMRVDNASSGGITCGIEPDGRLKHVAYSKYGDKYDKHPTSGIPFQDIQIPSYQNAIRLVKKLHPLIPHYRLVSWDIAIDKNNDPVLIEVNLKYGELDFHQLNNGPVFGDDTQKILEEVFHSEERK